MNASLTGGARHVSGFVPAPKWAVYRQRVSGLRLSKSLMCPLGLIARNAMPLLIFARKLVTADHIEVTHQDDGVWRANRALRWHSPRWARPAIPCALVFALMLAKIQAVLKQSPGLKAKDVAVSIGLDKKDVNSFLYRNKEHFYRDDGFNWFLVDPSELRIDLRTQGWLTSKEFEDALLSGASPLDAAQASIRFVLAPDSKMMIEALARLLALCNQLVAQLKGVTLDFSQCPGTLSYLNRVGFFDHLLKAVTVLPKRPRSSLATKFSGNNDGVVELLKIEFDAPDDEIPNRLGQSFVRCAGDEQYAVGAFTVLAELFGNVKEHSRSELGGFAGLQFYKRSRHIQAVISDSGVGIVGTLKPVLPTKYASVHKKIEASKLDYGVALLQEVFSKGRLSQSSDTGRGLGLKRSGELACQFRATISVRQESFELSVFHERDGRIRFANRLNLARIRGTHICFDLKLDGHAQSA
jgi:hypothetical protein